MAALTVHSDSVPQTIEEVPEWKEAAKKEYQSLTDNVNVGASGNAKGQETHRMQVDIQGEKE
jgi:hypothetical protein